MITALPASEFIFASLVTAALGRAFQAAEIVAAEYPQFSVEVFIEERLVTADPSELPTIRYLWMEIDPPGDSRGGYLNASITAAEMTRQLRASAEAMRTAILAAIPY